MAKITAPIVSMKACCFTSTVLAMHSTHSMVMTARIQGLKSLLSKQQMMSPMLAVRHEHVEDERAAERNHQVVHPALEGLAVADERGQADGGEERIPDYIEHREAGHKRDVIVKRQVRDPVAAGGRVLLDDEERGDIDGEVQYQPGILVCAHKFNGCPKSFAYDTGHSLGMRKLWLYDIMHISTAYQR